MENTERKFLNVKPERTRLLNLIEEIMDGEIKVPVFQRDFVWKSTQMLELFDSILKGYPIGSLLLWRPNNEFETKESIGPYQINSTYPETRYVLDGFQRLSTLFGVLTNPKNANLSPKYISVPKEFTIYYNLKTKEFTHSISKSDFYSFIPAFKIVDTFEFIDFLNELTLKIDNDYERKQLIDSAKEINKILYDYQIPHVEIRGGDIKSAVEIFSRINSTGTEISQDFMLSALSYNHSTGFLLSEKISRFLDHLGIYNFENLKRDTILNCIANSLNKVYFDVKTEELLKIDLEKVTDSSFIHIEKAVSFLHQDIRIWDLRLLPYPTQLIFISEYFRINPNPTSSDYLKLNVWFWRTTYSNYFTIYSLSQQREAYKIFADFARDAHFDGILLNNDGFETAKFPEKLNFTGVRTKDLQLFMIRNAYNFKKIENGTRIRELFFFSKRDRSPGNMILVSDIYFEENGYTTIENFFDSLDDIDKERYFLSDEIMQAYNDGNYTQLIELRENLIRESEREFINYLEIHYNNRIKLDW